MSLGYFFVRGGVGVGHSVDEICGEERHNACGVLRNRVQRCTREGASTAGLQEEPWEEGSVKDVSVRQHIGGFRPLRKNGKIEDPAAPGHLPQLFDFMLRYLGVIDPDPSSTVLASYWYSIMTVAMVSDEIG
ncbi:uncharacterized protein H6S33_000576 [Morchella sextelata]|uniref:uncharacterized protein n=1 Tax=Morchella sextelata TaxID=1174677 RepID=UPI001D04EC19|nr:uncharacterized protein H6S33_000576 [Morchella sextelata]KAH0614940.1 hypothetical protein H6S33_000576 [Morchella sextelata]